MIWEEKNFTDAEKALIREIARQVIDEVLGDKLPAIFEKYCCSKSCIAKEYFENDEKRYDLLLAVSKIKQEELEKKDIKKERRIWFRWIIGVIIGGYSIKELIEYFKK